MLSTKPLPLRPRLCALLGGAWILISTVAIADVEIYFADLFYPTFSNGYIYTVHSDGSGLETIHTVGGGLRGIAIDETAAKLYWTDVEADVIRWSDLDGGNDETIIDSGLVFPLGIDVHPAANMLVWGDQSASQLGSAQLDGSNAGPLLATPFHAGIAVDEVGDKIYWSTSITSADGEIRRANLNGSGGELLVADHDKPARLALDVAGGKMYWTDYVQDVVRRADLDGTNVEDLYVVGANLNPGGIALDLAAGKIYWGQAHDINRCDLMRMNLDGSNPEIVLSGDFGIISDIALVQATVGIAEAGAPPATPLRLVVRPNPIRALAEFSIEGEAPVEGIEIFDPAGRLIERLRPASAMTWRPGAAVPAGIYFARVRGGGAAPPVKLVVVR